jgi:hypothetical protein
MARAINTKGAAMIDATIHYQRAGSKRQRLAALPMANDYLAYQGQLWKVDSVLFNPTPQVYCLAVADDRQTELEQSWADWSKEKKALNGT